MSLTIFKFQKLEVRTVMIKNEPWFVAADVAETLGYRDSHELCKMLDDDEAGTEIVRAPSKNQHGTFEYEKEMTVISESGMYHAIFNSRKEEAKAFRKWVTSVVLPTIRKTGEYIHERYLTETLPYALSDIEDKMYRLESELREMNIQLNKAKRALLPKPSPKKTKAELKFQALKDAALCELHTSGVSMTLKELSSKIGVPTYELAQVLNTTQEVKQDRDKNPFNPTLSM